MQVPLGAVVELDILGLCTVRHHGACAGYVRCAELSSNPLGPGSLVGLFAGLTKQCLQHAVGVSCVDCIVAAWKRAARTNVSVKVRSAR
jgi:hypothetical protein